VAASVVLLSSQRSFEFFNILSGCIIPIKERVRAFLLLCILCWWLQLMTFHVNWYCTFRTNQPPQPQNKTMLVFCYNGGGTDFSAVALEYVGSSEQQGDGVKSAGYFKAVPKKVFGPTRTCRGDHGYFY
jgi:hypothetical protein